MINAEVVEIITADDIEQDAWKQYTPPDYVIQQQINNTLTVYQLFTVDQNSMITPVDTFPTRQTAVTAAWRHYRQR